MSVSNGQRIIPDNPRRAPGSTKDAERQFMRAFRRAAGGAPDGLQGQPPDVDCGRILRERTSCDRSTSFLGHGLGQEGDSRTGRPRGPDDDDALHALGEGLEGGGHRRPRSARHAGGAWRPSGDPDSWLKNPEEFREERWRPHRDSNCTEPANHNPATTHAKAEFARESEAADRQERLDRL